MAIASSRAAHGDVRNGDVAWAVVGPGNIAGTFVSDLQHVPGARLAAVVSRSARRARAFAQRFHAETAHESVADMLAQAAVDVAYIATPHPAHALAVRQCLEAGVAVLCEKPLVLNAAQAAELVALARRRGVFLMEAMWSRFLPAGRALHEMLEAGVVGEPRALFADFGFRAEVDPQHRLFDLGTAGGALLDVGIYPLALASQVFGEPAQATSLAHLGETGVDEQGGYVLRYGNGALAMLYSAIRTRTPCEAVISGTRGLIRVAAPFYRPQTLVVERPGAQPERMDYPLQGNGYGYEAMAVMQALRDGATESAIMPLDETVAIARTMDRLRAQWKLRYPREVER